MAPPSSRNATTRAALFICRLHRGLFLHSSNTLSLAAYSVFSGTPRSNNLVSKSSFSDSFKMLITRTFSKSSRLAPPVALLAHSKYSSSSMNGKLKTTAFAFSGGSEENPPADDIGDGGDRDADADDDVFFLLLRPVEDPAHGKQLFGIANRFPMLSFRNISGVHPSRAISSSNASNGELNMSTWIFLRHSGWSEWV